MLSIIKLLFQDYPVGTADDENEREMNTNKKKIKKIQVYNAPGLHTTRLTFHSALDEHTINARNALALAHN